MQRISVYDIEAEQIEKICEERNTTEAELIEALLSAVEDGTINLEDYGI